MAHKYNSNATFMQYMFSLPVVYCQLHNRHDVTKGSTFEWSVIYQQPVWMFIYLSNLRRYIARKRQMFTLCSERLCFQSFRLASWCANIRVYGHLRVSSKTAFTSYSLAESNCLYYNTNIEIFYFINTTAIHIEQQ